MPVSKDQLCSIEMISSADDFELVRVDGVDPRYSLGYAALHRIVLPFIDRIGHLPPPQREALESALGSVLLDHRSLPRQLGGLGLIGDIERTSPASGLSSSTTHTGLTSTPCAGVRVRRPTFQSATRMVVAAPCADVTGSCSLSRMARAPPREAWTKHLRINLLLSLARLRSTAGERTRNSLWRPRGSPWPHGLPSEELSLSQLAGQSPSPTPSHRTLDRGPIRTAGRRFLAKLGRPCCW